MINTLNGILAMCIGKANAMTSAEIAHRLGIKEDDTHMMTRHLILKCVEKHHLPLVASNKGYYIIDNEDELNTYLSSLDKRIYGIEKRKRIIQSNFDSINSKRKEMRIP
jgi:hypothetical protein